MSITAWLKLEHRLQRTHLKYYHKISMDIFENGGGEHLSMFCCWYRKIGARMNLTFADLPARTVEQEEEELARSIPPLPTPILMVRCFLSDTWRSEKYAIINVRSVVPLFR